MKNYNIRRLLSVLLVLVMLVPVIGMPASSADIPCGEAGCFGKYRSGICSADPSHFEAPFAEDGVYQIGNAGQLCWFAELVNSGANEYENGDNGEVHDAVLTADISLEGVAWTPIGLYTSAREYVRYSGTFDGAGRTIYGLTYDNTTYTGRVAGLFGCLDRNGTVKAVTLAESSVNGATDIGGIAAHNYGLIIGCTQLGTVTGTGTTGGIVSRNLDGGRVEDCVNSGSVTGAITGGIAGENAGELAGCTNGGSVSGTNSVGGVVGINSGAAADCRNTANVTAEHTHGGGVAGNHVGGSITRCGSSGDVTGGSDYIGGVAGVCSGAEIRESFNTGSVTGTGASEAVGGIVGAVDGTNLAGSVVADCYNTGSVSGRSWIGGMVGVTGHQKTPQTLQIDTGYSIGSVTGTSRTGAVVGAMNKGTVSGVYYPEGLSNALSGTAAATAEQFASGEIACMLNGTREGLWRQNLDAEPDAAPVLDPAHGVVYFGYRNCTERGYTNRPDYDVPGDHIDADGDRTCDLCGEELETQRVNPFTDVPEDSFYIDPVLWAVEQGITTGTTETTFDPNGVCQRAVVVTFLWRAAGKPEPTTDQNPFTDVKESDFFYKAVLWAVEQGITNGTSADTFSPYAQCNRAQVVTFLYRSQGSPAISAAEDPFSDVNASEWYGPAVLWAVENGITNGMGDGTFGITRPCNRAQVVTFLYRTLA